MDDVFSLMREHLADLTPREREVHDIIAQDPQSVLGSSSVQFARNHGVSQSAVSRFAQKIGLSGYSELRMLLFRALPVVGEQGVRSDANPPATPPPASPTPAADGGYADTLVAYARAVTSAADAGQTARVARSIAASACVYTLGWAASAVPSRYFALCLSSIHRAFAVEAGWELEQANGFAGDDALVVFSSKNPTFQSVFDSMAELGAAERPFVVLVTNSRLHAHAGLADEVVVLPTWRDLDYRHYIDPASGMVTYASLLLHAIATVGDDERGAS